MTAVDLGAPPLYEDFVRAHTPRLLRLVRRRLGDPGEAEELVQETLLRAHAHWDGFTSEAGAAAWTTTVATRLVVDRLRVRGRSVSVPEVAEGLRTAPDTADVVVARAEARVALDALEALPPRQAAVLWAREVEGLSYGDIGARHGLSEPSVRSLLLRGRKGLRAEFARRGGTAPRGVVGALGAVLPLSPALDALRAAGRLRRTLTAGAAATTATLGVVAATVLSLPAAAPPGAADPVPVVRAALPVPAAAAPDASSPAATAGATAPGTAGGPGPGVGAAAAVAPATSPAAAAVPLPGACVAGSCLDPEVRDEDRRDPAVRVPLPDNPVGLEEVGVSVGPVVEEVLP